MNTKEQKRKSCTYRLPVEVFEKIESMAQENYLSQSNIICIAVNALWEKRLQNISFDDILTEKEKSN